MYAKEKLKRLYKKETNHKMKERLLLVYKVKHDNTTPDYAADELQRSRPWALYWLNRFSTVGIEGLQFCNKKRSGRPPNMSKDRL